MSEIKVNSVVNSTGDNDSGLDLSTNDQVIVKTANTTAVTVDSSQNVGIGITDPADKLQVANTSGSVSIALEANTTGTSSIKLGDTANTSAGEVIYDNSNNSMAFHTAGSERARVDSSGNLLVGTTDSSPYNNTSTTGFAVDSAGYFSVAREGAVGYFNRITSDGEVVKFRKGGAENGFIGVSSGDLTIGTGDTGLKFSDSSDSIFPVNGTAGRDNAIDVGNASFRFDDVRATNGTIQTSDRNDKQDIEELSDAEQRVAVVAKGLMRKYRWKDKVAEKGDNARTHFGIIAQDLQDAFTAEGLDAGDYAMFISDTWWEKEISVDAVEADEENGIEAKDAYTYMDIKEEETEGYTEKTRLGVRYSELLAFIISAI